MMHALVVIQHTASNVKGFLHYECYEISKLFYHHSSFCMLSFERLLILGRMLLLKVMVYLLVWLKWK